MVRVVRTIKHLRRSSNFCVPHLPYLSIILSSAYFTFVNFSSLAKLNSLLYTKHAWHTGASNKSSKITHGNFGMQRSSTSIVMASFKKFFGYSHLASNKVQKLLSS